MAFSLKILCYWSALSPEQMEADWDGGPQGACRPKCAERFHDHALSVVFCCRKRAACCDRDSSLTLAPTQDARVNESLGIATIIFRYSGIGMPTLCRVGKILSVEY